MNQRYTITFGWRFDKNGYLIQYSQDVVERLIERMARAAQLGGYTLNFGRGCYTHKDGTRVLDWSGTLTVYGDLTTREDIYYVAGELRDELHQESVIVTQEALSSIEFF